MQNTGSPSVKIALFQFNPIVGALSGNADRIIAAMTDYAGKVDIFLTPESSITGYPVEDMVLSAEFMDEVEIQIDRLREAANRLNLPVMVGAPLRSREHEGKITNSVVMLGAREERQFHKHQLPNYGPFDEKRWFETGAPSAPFTFHGVRIGVLICEDAWFHTGARIIGDKGCDFLFIANGSPYVTGKNAVRRDVVDTCYSYVKCPVVYLNQVGGQDELVFDGASFIVDCDGSPFLRFQRFAEEIVCIEVTKTESGTQIEALSPIQVDPTFDDDMHGDYQALVLALRDYVGKNGFAGVMLGVSGGIDSALSATIAVDALGPERVRGIMMPYKWTSEESLSEAKAVTDNLSIAYEIVQIIDAVETVVGTVDKATGIKLSGVALENLQARMRGLILMAFSNQVQQERPNYMVLSTGNKSEVSVGYATLYGDMCGGYNILKDVYKTEVYALSAWRNSHKPAGCLGPSGTCVPEHTITRAPSAELAPGQKDDDSLPPYDTLDGILRMMVDDWKSVAEIVKAGYPRETVLKVHKMLDRAEYKRRQGAPGAKITKMIFGRDRRVPITNHFQPE